jgi:glycosyltransferase involved in cell wall biosynthesis
MALNINRSALMTDRRIKILHLITGLDTGGAEVSLQRLTGAMDHTRFENVAVSLTNHGPLSKKICDQGIRVKAIRMSRSLPSPAALWRLYRLLCAERPDVLQTWLYHSDLVGLLMGRAARVPAIAWNIRCSYMGIEYQRGIKGILVRTLARLSKYPDVVVANSHAGREEHVARGYTPRRWAVLENGFDLTVFKSDDNAPAQLRRELGLDNQTILIGLVARYDPLKDHQGFLIAAAELLKIETSVHFVLAGGGVDDSNSTLGTLIKKLGIGDRVHLMGRRDDVPKINAGLDIATCCSRGEGFPNIVGEAMACAVPCVVTEVGDAARIVGDTGIVVPPGDPQALAQGWHKMIEMGAEERAALGRRAKTRIEINYALSQCIDRYQDFYEVLSQRASSKGKP